VHIPVAQLICSSHDLSRIDLMFAQAYYALRQQVGPAGWQSLKAEAVDFENRTLQRCGVPAAGLLPPDPRPWVACLSAEYERQRTIWLSRLNGAARQESSRPVDQHVVLQRDLQSLGFLPPTATIDGVYGDATRSAIQAWQQSRGAVVTGLLGNQDAITLAQQADTGSPPATPAGTKPPAAAPDREFLDYIGSHEAGAYVVNKSGIGSTNAEIQILLDWDREERACADEYKSDPGNKDEAGYTRCITYAKEHFTGPKVETARANCQTGEMVGFWQTVPRFYVGQVKQMGLNGDVYYEPAFDYEGFRVGNYSYTGVGADGAIFQKLCPTSFIGPPQTSPPELNLSADCNEILADAERTATEAGFSHVLNVKIIDAWDVKSEGDTWYAARCSAKIMLNTDAEGKATLQYEVVPRHGKYFIQTRVVP
jgi:peptidoglycan hydrolase-like protein with peptidoglycan-binding domain